MWMQLLESAGFPILGEKYMRNWEQTIKEANPHGFYESILRRGIYYATNPHPQSGVYVPPSGTEQVVVKVFPPGLVRTDLAFIDKVIVTMRPWREYVASIERLYEMEHAFRLAKVERGPGPQRPPKLAAHLEWWLDNYLVVRDIATRGYPARITTYHRVLRDPRSVVTEVFRYLGAGDVEAAVERVSPETRTQHMPDVEAEIDPEHIALFDELFTTVDEGRGLSVELITKMNAVHEALLPQVDQQIEEVRAFNQARRRRRARKPDASLAASIVMHDDLPSTDDLALSGGPDGPLPDAVETPELPPE